MTKYFDEKVGLQSEKRREWLRKVREERLQGLQRAQKALPVWPAHQQRRSSGETSVRGPIVANKTGGARRQFVIDLPQSLRQKEKWRRGLGGEDRTRVR